MLTGGLTGAADDLRRGLTHWRVWWILGLQDIDLRYRRSFLGPFWISASLVFLMLTLGYIYGPIQGASFVTYVHFLGAGLLAWNLISGLINEGAGGVLEHEAYLHNVPLPLSAIAFRIVLRNALIFLHNLIAVIVTLLFFGIRFSPIAALSLIGLALILVFGFCASIALGPFSTRYRDVRQVIASVLQVAFFLTPIIWIPVEGLHRPEIADFNPFYHMVETVRAPLRGAAPTAVNWMVAGATCAITGLAALVSLAVTRHRVALWL